MDLDRDAKRILDLASEARTPAAADKARVEHKLAAVLGASVIAATPAVATEVAHAASTALGGAKAASSGALKWWISSAVIVSAVTGYVALSSSPQTPAPVQRKTVEAKLVEPAPPPSAPPRPAPVVELAPPQEAPVLDAPDRPARTTSPKKRASTLGDEIELLHRAQAAWRERDARAAMALLDQHRTRFPRSDLKLERDGLRVLSLCELGRKAEASALAHKLIERAPRSPLRATIEESCALK